MEDSTMQSSSLAGLFTRQDAERYRAIARSRAREHQRILDAAKVDAASLSNQALHVLDSLADDPTTADGLVELLVATRMGVYTEWHKAEIDRKHQVELDGAARLDAAMARFDQRHTHRHCHAVEGPGVEL